MDDKTVALNESKLEQQATFEKSWYDMYLKENSKTKTFEKPCDDREILETSREFELELLDTSNEEKLTRLISENKINTPFKRRHSHSSSNSGECDKSGIKPNSNNGDGVKRLRKQNDKPRNASTSKGNPDMEKDPLVLARRQKQIDYGKNTIGYENYVKAVPRSERTRDHPKTPRKNEKYSRRAWEGVVKVWRKKLHVWDDEDEEDDISDDDLDLSDGENGIELEL